MKKLLALLLLTSPAFGQSVQQSGNITPGHVAQWVTTGVIRDGGAPSGGVGLLGSFVINDMLCANATGATISIIDCGFSATGTNNWVGLQNLNGGATAPTRAPGDSTTNVATTAFVQAFTGTASTWTGLQIFNGGAMIPETSTGVSARPSPVEVWPNAGFTGDNTKINYGIRYSISGAATLGTPIGGTAMAPVYITTPEATPFVSIVSSTAGANTDLGDNYNRTATLQMAQYGLQIGQGDFIQSYCYMELDAHLVGATDFIANPAITCLGGALAPDAAGAGGFINPINFVVTDNGFDIAAIMHSSAGDRTNDAAALNEPWIGTLWQSIGTKAWDSFFSGAGKTKIGIDLTNGLFNASGSWTQAAEILPPDSRIYFNGTAGTYFATATGSDYIRYSTADGGLVFTTGGVDAFEVISGQNASINFLNALQGFSVTGNATINGQIISGAGLPTIASGACGTTTNGAVVAGSTNQAGNITIGAVATTTCTISWSATLASVPKACVFYPANAAAAATGTTVAFVSSITNAHVVLTGSALANANYGYICL